MVAKPDPTAAKTLGPILPFAWRQNLRAFRHFAGWGAAAALALTAVVLISQTQLGSERLQMALAQAREPEPQAVAAMPPRVIVDAEETRRLEDAVRKLAADRDRLKERIANLERNFDDMTGSIKTVMLANAAAQGIKDSPQDKPAMTAAAPAPATPATIPSPAAAAMPPAAAKTTEKTADMPADPAPPAAPTPVPGQSEIVPLPPVRVASTAPETPAEPAKIDFAVDLGGRLSMDALRAHWLTVKAKNGPLLEGLRPLVTQRVRPNGTDYRLVLGPLPTVTEAAKLCAKFAAVHATCRAGKFIGEELAIP